jgi:hypothetical protein
MPVNYFPSCVNIIFIFSEVHTFFPFILEKKKE